MGKPTFSMNENVDADQLRGNRATVRSASFVFRYNDSRLETEPEWKNQ